MMGDEVSSKSKIKYYVQMKLLVWFYGISTIVGYSVPDLDYTYILDLYDLSKYWYLTQTIQLNINNLFTHS